METEEKEGRRGGHIFFIKLYSLHLKNYRIEKRHATAQKDIVLIRWVIPHQWLHFFLEQLGPNCPKWMPLPPIMWFRLWHVSQLPFMHRLDSFWIETDKRWDEYIEGGERGRLLGYCAWFANAAAAVAEINWNMLENDEIPPFDRLSGWTWWIKEAFRTNILNKYN